MLPRTGRERAPMKEVTKEQFKQLYFKHGGKDSGWTRDYWNRFFEQDERPGVRYLAEEPETRRHTRMMIASDADPPEHRLFFMTEEAEEGFFRGEDE